ncbi:Glycosyl transferase family 2 [Butyrivibrio sp. ob235]|uniref:glycosyltransferase family A protein n=1 Tax=Butyrivibrio sp. ob235 TaxID=1761780 RepID=UPI0008C904B9|nr:glycosyltransferase family A protein [Butyrivibrio sp. ob235]SEL73285.1 Glycosyl transferase family 2 [Butyrivibrio sp. ob235]
MNEEKLVSVVVPTHNGERYIKYSIESIINQTYKNLEVIIIDDGSTDSVNKICRGYADKDKRIKLITTDNKGVSAARNRGIAEANGDYLIFSDDDDYLEYELVEKYIEAHEQWHDKNVAFITCGMFIQNEYNKRVGDRISILEQGRGYIKGENYLLTRNSAATLAWLKIFNFITNKCYDLKKIKENSVLFDKSVSVAEDLKFNLDYLEVCDGNIGMVNMPLYHYIKRKNDGLSLKYHSDDLDNTKEIYRQFMEWEKKQPGVTEDNLNVLKSLYIQDWTNRLTAIYQMHKGESPFSCAKRSLNRELRSREFRTMLHEVRKAKKIRMFRYMCLRTGNYEVFYFFRAFYQLLKG